MPSEGITKGQWQQNLRVGLQNWVYQSACCGMCWKGLWSTDVRDTDAGGGRGVGNNYMCQTLLLL